jgi:chromosome segregation ATPase
MARKRKSPAKKKSISRADLNKQINAVRRQLDWLMSEVKKAEAGARKSAERELRALKRRQAQAQKALAKLGRQSAAASGPLIAGLQKAWHDMGLAMHQAAKRYRATS